MLIARLWRLGLGAAALAWMGLIFYLSSLSAEAASQPLETGAVSWLGELRSYVAHVFLFGVLASLILAFLWGWKSGYQLRWALSAAAFAAIYGISDEYHQSFVLGRSASIADVLVNIFAAIAAAGCMWLVAIWWRGRIFNTLRQHSGSKHG